MNHIEKNKQNSEDYPDKNIKPTSSSFFVPLQSIDFFNKSFI